MRLLQYSESGELSIHSFDDGDIPPYAILSHTWGANSDEVTFADLQTGGYKIKPGYEKILFCGKQARCDNLQYFWIDTCCIDTTDRAEHSRAIHSMFHWYRSATKCYVFLSDVSINADGISVGYSSELAFRSSRWFTRGWTLQELLAPTVVEFYSQEGKILGNKMSLKLPIHKTTGIPLEVLNGTPLPCFSIKQRLQWKSDRQTKRDEDAWYSLAGVLDVEIAPAYGEGGPSAFKRLMDEIHKLERCTQDIRQTDPRDDKKRIEETKGGLLADSYRWILDNTAFRQWHEYQHSRLLWVKGDPGKGKTMLLCGIINELRSSIPQTALLSYFFCQATDSRINSATAVLRGLLYMLIHQQPSLLSHVRKKYDHAGKSLFEDANAWVVLMEIFANVLQDTRLNTTYLIIDALDECVTDRLNLLSFIARQSSASSRVKWIVSSRNWPDIEEELKRAEHKIKLSLELNAELVAAAVKAFIKQEVYQLAQEKRYTPEVQDAVLQHLTSNANDTFLWVALVCQDLKTTPKWNVLKKLAQFPPGLDSLYKRMLQQISESDSADMCLRVLAVATVLYRPVTVAELVMLTEQLADLADDLESVREIINFCGSFLTLRQDIVYFVHQSAQDFLFDKVAAKVFPSGKGDVHHSLFIRSLQVLSATLRRDMYDLKEPGYSIDDLEHPQSDPLAATRYLCVYWADHLCDAHTLSSGYPEDLQDGGVVDTFLQKKYLYWLEGLSLCKSLPRGAASIARLQSLVKKQKQAAQLVEPVYNKAKTVGLYRLVRDAFRFIMYHKGAIERAPLQTYVSALIFSPTGSLIRNLFRHEASIDIVVRPGMNSDWSACLQTLEGHSDDVISVAFSHDATQLASASIDQTVKIWDTDSGACLQTLKGHSSVESVVFSHKTTRLASVSTNITVKNWDTSSGMCLETFEGHSDGVTSVAFSYDGTQLASGSQDGTVHIWDKGSGTCLQTFEGHSDEVRSVDFSHDGTQLASASWDSTVRIWDTENGLCLHTLRDHGDEVRSVAFSHDGTRLASGSGDRTVKIWNASSGVCLQTLKGHGRVIVSMAFSHDGNRLATASGDRTIKIWDMGSGMCLQTLEGHCEWPWSVAFSPDGTRLASGSGDKTVKIWDVGSGACPQTLEGHRDFVTSVAISHDATRLATASGDNTLKIWAADNGACLQTFKGHGNEVFSVAFSHDATRLASASSDRTVKIWDAGSGACLQTLEGRRFRNYTSTVAFSHDATLLASASGDETVKVWDVGTGACLQTFEGHSDDVSSAAFCHDKTWLAATSGKTIKIWKMGGGTCLQTLEGHSDLVRSLTVSDDANWLASTSNDCTVKLWDASSGACLQTLNVGRPLGKISFDTTSSCLYTDIGTFSISYSVISKITLVPQHPQYQDIALSSDTTVPGWTWITYRSKNLLWLPPEYRPSDLALSGKVIGIGVGSGKVWLCSIRLLS